MKYALVTTTVNVPHNLEAYRADFKKHDHDVDIIVAGDRKTDQACDAWCTERGFYYLSPDTQSLWLRENGFHDYEQFLPWNCIQRRNVAILYAYQAGAEIIATIDDDNLWEGSGYFWQHGPLGTVQYLTAHDTLPHGWYNAAFGLNAQTMYNFYPRGYSFRERGACYQVALREEKGRVVVNGGLWLGDPDIDAVTRLSLRPNVRSWQPPDTNDGKIVLGIGTKCPFNSQNTALHRDVIPAYCLATGLGRYDDIIGSYIVKRIADHLGDYISFGHPIVRQVRNKHDLFEDLEDELIGMQIIDRFVDWLYEIPVTCHTYRNCVAEIIHGLNEKTKQVSLTKEQEYFIGAIIVNYNHWLKIFP